MQKSARVALLASLVAMLAGIAESQPELEGTLEFAGASPIRIQLGNPLQLKATGALATTIAAELSKQDATLTLYLDGVRMDEVAARRGSQATPGVIDFSFDLVRNAQNDKSRQAWDALLATQHDWNMELDAAIGVGKNPARLVDARGRFTLYVAERNHILASLVVGLIILVVGLALVARFTTMLKDEGTGLYSLGKTQMAFWGLLVVLTFTGIWILTGTMERIPAQVLILLGISAGTGLSSVLIDRDSNAAKLANLQAELAALNQRQKNTQLTPDETVRLAKLPSEIAALEKAIAAAKTRGFWADIVNDGNGASFHRVQVVIWTLVLGAAFVRTVLETISMPEFPETLLVLMGISNGTYIGFKTMEK